MGKIGDSIDKLLDVCNRNALDVKKSQCNSTIRAVVWDKKLSSQYEIEVNRGQPHKIPLDRSLVSIPDVLKNIQL